MSTERGETVQTVKTMQMHGFARFTRNHETMQGYREKEFAWFRVVSPHTPLPVTARGRGDHGLIVKLRTALFAYGGAAHRFTRAGG
jgi:hypothetical protein